MPRLLGLIVIAGLLGCRGESRSNPLMGLMAEDLTEAPTRGSLLAFRLPAGGGDARLYYLPTMAEEAWRFDWGPYETAHTVGFSASDEIIYALTTTRDLVTLDLATGRTRKADSAVALAVLDAADRTIVAHEDGSIALVANRAVSTIDTLPTVPTAIWGGVGERVLALVETDETRELLLLEAEKEPVRQPVPGGQISVAMWGDMVAVAADSGLVLLLPDDPSAAHLLPLQPMPQLVAFSPSGHEIHMVLGEREWVTINRFTLTETRRITLPGGAKALRPDLTGQRLLIKQDTEGQIWMANLGRYRLRSVAADWDDGLPRVLRNGDVLGRRGDSLVVLSSDSLVVLGATRADPKDRWVAAVWEAHQPAHQIANTSAESQRMTGQVFYVQVSSSRNPVWAEDFARRLRVAGMTALVLTPDDLDELYHVVLGPYTTRQEAETVGRSVGLPFWVMTRQGEFAR